MRLFIAEKPELAKAICTGLGGGFKQLDGYYQHPTRGDTVTWCFGHMLALKDPDDIDPKYEHWLMADLPIPPMFPAPRQIPSDKKKQVTIIRDLVKQADIIVNAGDPDEEGQLLIDGLLRFFGNKKPIMRVLINDNTPAVVKKSLANLRPNSEFEHLGWIAESRTIADQSVGYNLTRAYSLSEQAKTGSRDTWHIGRVQTVVLGLVVRRDRENASHKKSFYYTIAGDFVINGVTFTAKYQPKESDPTDDKGRLIDKAFADNLAKTLTNQFAKVLVATTTAKADPAPLPYNLIKLQGDASRLYGISAKQTDQITQSLREKHHLITYNRSDCQYLSDEQFFDVGAVLNGIMGTLPNSQGVCATANQAQKGRAFNSSKVSAHHAIIPTQTQANWSDLTVNEQHIYKLIARSYIAQFYPPYEYDETKLMLDVVVDGMPYQFSATARFDKSLGWKTLYRKDPTNEEVATDEDTQLADLRSLVSGMNGQSGQIDSTECETKPKPLYTEQTLLKDLTQVAKYVKDPRLAKVLKDRDKDKQSEHGGIGTPATRATIMDKLFGRGYLTQKVKSIVSTDRGKALYDLLDDTLRYPDLTAIWHEQQKQIKTGADVQVFVNKVAESTVYPVIDRLKQGYVPPSPKPKEDLSNNPPCPKCGRPLKRAESKFKKGEYYWGCTGWNDTANPCKHTMNDKDGVPTEREPKPAQNLSEFDCKKCGKKLIYKDGISKKTGKPYSFYTCSGFPKCKTNYDEVNGVPKYE